MSQPLRPAPPAAAKTFLGRLPHRLVVPFLLAVSAALAVTSLLGDSFTFDETGHLTAGFSHVYLGDFRLQPEHPPLAKLLAALPLLSMDHNWAPPDAEDWRESATWQIARTWLFERADGERLLIPARCVMVALLLVTNLLVYLTAWRLFGRNAGLLALMLAALSPTLLAHGRLVTTDLPAALAVTLALLSVARVLARFTWWRLALAVIGVGVLPLTKTSALIALPALLTMFLAAIFWKGSTRLGASLPRPTPSPNAGRLIGRPRRVLALCVLGVTLTLTTWVAIWTTYRWRYSAFTGPDRDAAVFYAIHTHMPETCEEAWEATLQPAAGRWMQRRILAAVRFARDHRLLPEAYLYGIAHTLRMTSQRWLSYLNGEIYAGGRAAYFPVAFLIKTPIPTLALLLAGVAALALRRAPRDRDPTLLIGLIAFVAICGASAVTADYNFGHRHILPLYPVLFVLAGAGAGWLTTRVGRVGILVALGWLALANARIYPHYLSYFNEAVGGPARGHLYLADSNIDWGQDLKRLARYAAQHPQERIKLAYFGSADPTHYGFTCDPLPSFRYFGDTGELTPGTYVVSISQLLGLRMPEARVEIWQKPRVRDYYRRLYKRYVVPGAESAPATQSAQRDAELEHLDVLQPGRLLCQLRQRPPDERIGWSLWVYRLTQEEIDELLKP
jgi:hypothetical protein